VNDLSFQVANAMGVEANVIHLPPRNEVLNAYSSHDKVRKILGNRSLISLDEGLSGMAHWVKNHGARSSQKFSNIEIRKNFPQAWIA
jgi:UDP-glucose 4-epimerase